MAFSFSTSGATPNVATNPLGAGSLNMGGSTPQAKALNQVASHGSFLPKPAPAPVNQPVKKQTLTDASGNTHITEYHPPAQSTPVVQSTAGSLPPTGTANGVLPPPTPTYPGIITSLANTATQGSPEAQQNNKKLADVSSAGSTAARDYTSQAANYGAGNIALGQKAQDIAKNYSDQIADVTKNAASGQIGLLTSGAMNPVALGRSGIIEQNASAEQAALAAAEQQALAGNAQALTGQGQAANAANDAAGQANTAQSNTQSGLNSATGNAVQQQGQVQSGLSSAGNLAQPSGNFPFVFDPLTGTFKNSGGGVVNAQDAAQGVLSGHMTYDQAKSSLGYLGQTGEAQLQAAIHAQNPNADIASLQAQGAAKQGNVQTAGTAGIQAANAAYQTAVQNVSKATQSYSSLTGISGQLNSTLANWGNTGLLTNYNQALNTIAGLTSNPEYQQFIVALGNTQAAYQSVLGSAGVTPTKADSDALHALSPNSSATAINAALNQLSKDAHALIVEPAYQQQQQYARQLGIQ